MRGDQSVANVQGRKVQSSIETKAKSSHCAPRTHSSLLGKDISPQRSAGGWQEDREAFVQQSWQKATAPRNTTSSSHSPIRMALLSSREHQCDSEQKHPDAHMIATLEDPSVMATVAGILQNRPKEPETVAFVLGNVHCLLGLDPSWHNVLFSLKSFPQFLQQIKSLDQGNVTPAIIETLRKRRRERPDTFDPVVLDGVNHACGIFAKWINAVCNRAGFESAVAAVVQTPFSTLRRTHSSPASEPIRFRRLPQGKAMPASSPEDGQSRAGMILDPELRLTRSPLWRNCEN